MLGQQGLITEAGYKEQADSYALMSSAARATASGEFGIADQTDQLAQQTKDAGDTASIAGFASSAFKGATSIASLFTGLPISAAVDGFVPETPSDPSNPLVINRYGQPGPASNNPANPATPLGAIY